MLNKGLAPHEPAARDPAVGPARQPSEPSGDVPAAATHAAAFAAARPLPPPVLDPKALAQLQSLDLGGSGDFVDRVLRTYQSSAARLSAELAAARGIDDTKVVRRVVHTLKSSSASIGATTLSSVCGGIEKALLAGACPADLASELDRMIGALETTLAAIQQRLDPAR